MRLTRFKDIAVFCPDIQRGRPPLPLPPHTGTRLVEKRLLSFTSSSFFLQLLPFVLRRIYPCREAHAVLDLYSGVRPYTCVFAAAESSPRVRARADVFLYICP